MKEILKKWWFWVCLVIITLIIGFTAIMLKAFDEVAGELGETAKQVEDIYSEATLYRSAGANTLILELPNLDISTDTGESTYSKVKSIIYDNNKNFENTYSKLTTLITTSINESTLMYKEEYDLTSGDTIQFSGYIDYDTWKNTYDSVPTSTSTEDTSKTTSNNNVDTSTKQNTAETIELTAGNYVVGEDVKAGKYDAIAQSGRGNFFVHGTTSVIETLNASPDKNSISHYNNITLKNGDTIEVKSSLKVLLQAK